MIHPDIRGSVAEKKRRSAMIADVVYGLETLTGKRGALLEVVEAIVSDGRLIMILTDEDVLQKHDAPLKGIFYRVVLPLARSNVSIKAQAFSLVQETLKFSEETSGFGKLAGELGR
jgi:hypothetical protein